MVMSLILKQVGPSLPGRERKTGAWQERDLVDKALGAGVVDLRSTSLALGAGVVDLRF